MEIKQATTIEEVIQFLDEVIEIAKQEEKGIGMFASLYREVTLKIKEGIVKGNFQDGARMEKLDVIFANRYLRAYFLYQTGQKPSSCWEFAFQKSEEYWLIVPQHLLLGINAHVNLDLGIACALVSTTENIGSLKSDYDQINAILSELLISVEKSMCVIWPGLTFILKISGRIDNLFIDFSMKKARDGAWKFANEFVALNEDAREPEIQERDAKITQVAQFVSNPGFFTSTLFRFIRLFERGTVAEKIIELGKIE